MSTVGIVCGILLLCVPVGMMIYACIVEPAFRYAVAFLLSLVTGALLLTWGLHR